MYMLTYTLYMYLHIQYSFITYCTKTHVSLYIYIYKYNIISSFAMHTTYISKIQYTLTFNLIRI